MTEAPLEIKHLAEAKDYIPLCASWGYGLWGCHNKGSLERSLMRYTQGAQKSNIPLTLIAFYEKLPAGMISLWEQDHKERLDLTPWIASLYVHPSYRGKSIGLALLKRMEKEAEKLNYKELYLTTEEAEGLYAKNGWQTIEDTMTPFGPAKLMCKEIQPLFLAVTP